MTRTRYILTALAVSAATAATARADGPVTFARSGRPASVAVAAAGEAGNVALSAFARRWTEPAPVQRGAARISVPKLRAVTVFDVVTDAGARKVGELVAYTDRDVQWDQRDIIVAAGAPKWFRQWADAVGLPVRWLEGDEAKKWHSSHPEGKSPALVILGREAAGDTAAPLLRSDGDARPNVLVLDARWFGPAARAVARLTPVTPARMTGPLSDLRGEDWPKPLGFGAPAGAYPGICNRRAWIEGPLGPLVEEISAGPSPRRVVLSYLPWQQQLGRNESADRLLLAVLRAAGAGPRRARDARMVCPAAETVDADARPILAAATAVGATPPRLRSAPVLVVDLRGDEAAPADAADRLESLQRVVHAGSPLLILGDDPVLDGCKWLKIDRRKHRSASAHVRWLADDALPPTPRARIALMRELTNLNVSLREIKRENNDEDRNDH